MCKIVFRQVRFLRLLCYYSSYFSIISSCKTNYRVSATLLPLIRQSIYLVVYIFNIIIV